MLDVSVGWLTHGHEANHDWPVTVKQDYTWHVSEASPDNHIARFVNLIDRSVPAMPLEHAKAEMVRLDAIASMSVAQVGWTLAATGLAWPSWSALDVRDKKVLRLVQVIKESITDRHKISRG
ncbi:hypothetical protein Y032_0300g1799 [Ancylostoma ceylanicum]|uniref:Uncharacterized protein n=1 Tax=Ancylostoma ceylanicum TaxID=53326 RepID=A0A016S4A1_9BILA|nr:hypothetical protein Y032_0300g1799 [Ancylostoma ceylanicum]